MGYTDRLFNSHQGDQLIKAIYLSAMDQSHLSKAEKDYFLSIAPLLTGKVYRTRVYGFNTNTTSKGIKMDDNEGLVCTGYTDRTEGQDDYADIPLYAWQYCNYERDEDGVARLTVLEGMPGYKEEGSVDVGSISPMMYWTVDKSALWYDYIVSDTPHPELGLVPWCEGVKADGTVLPYYIGSAFSSGYASDGKPRSQPNLMPMHDISYANGITKYASKNSEGHAYKGAGQEPNTFLEIMMAIKYGTKNLQTVYAGVTEYNTQSLVGKVEADTKRVLVSAQASFVEGGVVSVGDPGSASAPDRNNATCHNIADRVVVKSIEQVVVDGENYYALNLELTSTITTTATTYVSTMPAISGTTKKVIGHHDGSPYSNTDGKHVFRVQGREYGWGQYVIAHDTIEEFNNTDYIKHVFVAEKGTPRLASAHTGYKEVGQIPDDGTNGSFWVGDMDVDLSTGASWPSAKGSGAGVGVGDYIYNQGVLTSTTNLREYLMFGALLHTSPAGLGCVHLGLGLAVAVWAVGSRD